MDIAVFQGANSFSVATVPSPDVGQIVKQGVQGGGGSAHNLKGLFELKFHRERLLPLASIGFDYYDQAVRNVHLLEFRLAIGA